MTYRTSARFWANSFRISTQVSTGTTQPCVEIKKFTSGAQSHCAVRACHLQLEKTNQHLCYQVMHTHSVMRDTTKHARNTSLIIFVLF